MKRSWHFPCPKPKAGPDMSLSNAITFDIRQSISSFTCTTAPWRFYGIGIISINRHPQVCLRVTFIGPGAWWPLATTSVPFRWTCVKDFCSWQSCHHLGTIIRSLSRCVVILRLSIPNHPGLVPHPRSLPLPSYPCTQALPPQSHLSKRKFPAARSTYVHNLQHTV